MFIAATPEEAEAAIKAGEEIWEEFVEENWTEIRQVEDRAKWRRERRIVVINTLKQKVSKEKIRSCHATPFCITSYHNPSY